MSDRGNGYWKVLGPVSLTLILSMTANYFLFVQHSVSDAQLNKVVAEIAKQIDANYLDTVRFAEQNRNDIRRLEGVQSQRSSVVADVPALRSEVNKLMISIGTMAADNKVLQSQIDGLRRNMRDFRQFLYTTTGKQPPPLQEGE